jgi:hypothetical protein
MKSSTPYALLAAFVLSAMRLGAQSAPIQFDICPVMWSDSTPARVDSVRVTATLASGAFSHLTFPANANSECISVSIPSFVQQSGATYQLAGFKQGAELNGLSVNDLVLLRSQILGIDNYNPLLDLIADANNSIGLTTFDLVLLQQRMLSVSNTANLIWVGLPEYWDLSQINAPSICCNSLTLAELSTLSGGEVRLLFFKKGDADGDANPLIDDYLPNYQTDIEITTPDSPPMVAQEVRSIPFLYDQQAGPALNGIQMRFSFDPNRMEFLDLIPGKMNVQSVVSTSDIRLIGLSNFTVGSSDDTLFQVKIKAKVAGNPSSFLTLVPDYIPATGSVGDLFNSTPSIARINVSPTSDVSGPGAFANVRVWPNPVGAAGATISFESIENEDIELIINDLAGRTIYQKIISVAPGSHQIGLSSAELPRSGVAYIQVRSGQRVSTLRVLCAGQ